jgi:hypothetical protein
VRKYARVLKSVPCPKLSAPKIESQRVAHIPERDGDLEGVIKKFRQRGNL